MSGILCITFRSGLPTICMPFVFGCVSGFVATGVAALFRQGNG